MEENVRCFMDHLRSHLNYEPICNIIHSFNYCLKRKLSEATLLIIPKNFDL